MEESLIQKRGYGFHLLCPGFFIHPENHLQQKTGDSSTDFSGILTHKMTATAQNWKYLYKNAATQPHDLPVHLRQDEKDIQKVISRYPMRINPYYLSLLKVPDGPLAKQVIPHADELFADPALSDDPLCENEQSPVPGLIHRYPDRVLLLVSGKCAVYCRFCMRKRRLGKPGHQMTGEDIEKAVHYIRLRPEVFEVILSGGDPLLLEDEMLFKIMHRIRQIPHVSVIRIHTRTPCVLPGRITEELARMIAGFHPVFMHLHFNHPDELTEEATRAISCLCDASIPLGSQTVLLKGINDSPVILESLFRKLAQNRIRPYYLHHPDLIAGTAHFRLSLAQGREIFKNLLGRVSGTCLPGYMLDLPGGRGKVPVMDGYCLTGKPE